MSRVIPKQRGMADVVLELDDDELEALREAVRDADGRRSEVKEARRILGVR